jgi:hypothetical protein
MSVNIHYQDEIADSMKDNIESLLTYLATDFPWKTDTQKYANRALYEKIVEIIQSRFELLAKNHEEDDRIHREYEPYFREIMCGSLEYDFITLNYDILLESLMFKIFETDKPGYSDVYKYPLEKAMSRKYAYLAGKPKMRIPAVLKLHGSANWFWAGAGATDPIYVREWKDKEEDLLAAGLTPYIVPPLLDKNLFYKHVATKFIWKEAERLLRQADEIYIVGFSFPVTDLSVRYLFQSSLRNRSPKIFVVNASSKKEIEVNYNEPLKGKTPSYEFCGNTEVLKSFLKKEILKNDINAL